MRRLVAAILAGATFLASAYARGEVPTSAPASQPTHFLNGARCETPSGNVRELPPGIYLAEGLYAALEAEVRRLQERETRLETENRVLKSFLSENPPAPQPSRVTSPKAKLVLIVTGVAFAAGFGVGLYLAR